MLGIGLSNLQFLDCDFVFKLYFSVAYFQLLDDNNRAVGSCEDPKELRKWLREMEHKLENAPTLSEATMLTCAELESHLNEHSVSGKC